MDLQDKVAMLGLAPTVARAVAVATSVVDLESETVGVRAEAVGGTRALLLAPMIRPVSVQETELLKSLTLH